VYLALLHADPPATAKDIAEISKIAKPDIYRIIPTLEKRGMVEKLVTKPVAFKAIDYTDVLPALLLKKRNEQDNLEKKTEELIDDLKKIAPRKNRNRTNEFSMVPGKLACIRRLKEEILNSQVGLSTVTTEKRFSAAIVEFESAYRIALKKGVRIRLATNRHIPQRKAQEIIEDLSADHNFQVKYFDGSTEAIVSVYDNKEACVMMTATAHLSGASAIWSNNACFIALAQNYFENKWNKSTVFQEAT
jgi:sugar-specific transcriptional regulator TrmB